MSYCNKVTEVTESAKYNHKNITITSIDVMRLRRNVAGQMFWTCDESKGNHGKRHVGNTEVGRWTRLSGNELWRVPEDRVTWRKHVSHVAPMD